MGEQILSLLAREHLSADEIRRRLELTHERVYSALVHLEALGKVEVWCRRKHDSRGDVVWREVM